MNKEQFIKLLDRLEEIYEQDNKEVQAWKDFISVIMPIEYSPIPEWKLSTVLYILEIEYPEVAELMSYYFFESKLIKGGWLIECDWKKYNYSKKEDVIQSMIDFWHISIISKAQD